jgi:hypothetical protein
LKSWEKLVATMNWTPRKSSRGRQKKTDVSRCGRVKLHLHLEMYIYTK